jgi:hypothetical protein
MIYMKRESVARFLESSKPDIFRAIESASDRYNVDGEIILGVNQKALGHEANGLIAKILQVEPTAAVARPHSSQKIMAGAPTPDATVPLTDEEEVAQTARKWFAENPAYYSDANFDVLKGKLAAHPETEVNELAAKCNFQLGPDMQTAIAGFFAEHKELEYCDANETLILRNIPKGALLTASAVEAAGMNVYKSLVKNPREMQRRANQERRAELEKIWFEKISQRTKPDPSWSLTVLEQQVELRLSRLKDLKQQVSTQAAAERPVLREAKLPPDYVYPPGVQTSGGVSDGIRRWPLDAATLAHVLRNEDVVANKLIKMFGIEQINARLRGE